MSSRGDVKSATRDLIAKFRSLEKTFTGSKECFLHLFPKRHQYLSTRNQAERTEQSLDGGKIRHEKSVDSHLRLGLPLYFANDSCRCIKDDRLQWTVSLRTPRCNTCARGWVTSGSAPSCSQRHNHLTFPVVTCSFPGEEACMSCASGSASFSALRSFSCVGFCGNEQLHFVKRL